MNTKPNHKKRRTTSQKTIHQPNRSSAQHASRASGAGNTGRGATTRRTSNVRVLRPNQNTQHKARLNYGRIITIGIIVYFVIWAIYPITNRIEQGRELESLKKQLKGIEEENQQLAKRVKYLKSDEYVEQKARALGLSRPDEEVIVVIPQDSKNPIQGRKDSVNEATRKQPVSLWQQVTDFFSGGS